MAKNKIEPPAEEKAKPPAEEKPPAEDDVAPDDMVLALYWDPGPYYIYGNVSATFPDEPAPRDDGFPNIMVLSPKTFVVTWIPKCSAKDAAWTGLIPGISSVKGQKKGFPAVWLQEQGLYRFQANKHDLFVFLVDKPRQRLLLKIEDENVGRACLPDGAPVIGKPFVLVPVPLFDLVP